MLSTRFNYLIFFPVQLPLLVVIFCACRISYLILILLCLSLEQHCRHGICVSKEIDRAPVDGEWGSWGPYSSCTRTCGGGIKSTTRLCNQPEYVFFFNMKYPYNYFFIYSVWKDSTSAAKQIISDLLLFHSYYGFQALDLPASCPWWMTNCLILFQFPIKLEATKADILNMAQGLESAHPEILSNLQETGEKPVQLWAGRAYMIILYLRELLPFP